MSSTSGSKPLNLARLLLLGTGAAVVLLLLFMVDDLIRFIPERVRNRSLEWTFAFVTAGYGLTVGWVAWRGIEAARWARRLDRLDAFSRAMLGSWLFRGLAVAAVVWLAAWFPHYLYWPWGRDADAFAEIARAWDAGERPYRDIRGYNFPGHIYLHWMLGKLFGWGRPSLYYAVDAAGLLTLGAVVLAWSRRRFGDFLPGMAAYLMFLGFYLDAHFELVTERDWHAALGATLALLVLQGWPGRRGRWVSAFLAAAAFTVRPHVVLFLPALAAAAMSGEDGSADNLGPLDWKLGARRVLEWAGAFGMFAAAGFAPLVFAGILDDLVRGLRVASYGGPYSTLTPARAVETLLDELREPRTAALVLALVCLSVRPIGGSLTATARTWLLAVAGALAYRPLHPVDHNYLRMPLALVGSTAWAVPIAWCVRASTANLGDRRRSFVGLSMIVLLLCEALPRWMPYNCSFRASFDSIRAATGSDWPDVPPGAWIWYGEDRHAFYSWDAYNRLLQYVREKTGPDTIVANVLKNPPFPPVNGPTGRRTPFHAETGIAWSWLVDQDLDEEFAADLERAGEDSIVVWSPEESTPNRRLELKRLTQVIRDEYGPEARFGRIEVWRRKPRKPAAVRIQSTERGDALKSITPQVAPP